MDPFHKKTITCLFLLHCFLLVYTYETKNVKKMLNKFILFFELDLFWIIILLENSRQKPPHIIVEQNWSKQTQFKNGLIFDYHPLVFSKLLQIWVWRPRIWKKYISINRRFLFLAVKYTNYWNKTPDQHVYLSKVKFKSKNLCLTHTTTI